MKGIAKREEMLKKIKNKLEQVEWKSSFDFESFEIDNETKKFIELREEKIVNSFKKYSSSKYELCVSLAEVKTVLFEKGDSFMSWYQNLGFTKDKVSELLKTYELYIQAPHLKDYVSSLSGLAVRLLTHKDVSPQLALNIMEQGIKNTTEIKELLFDNKEEEQEIKEEKLDVKIEKKYEKHLETFVEITNDIARRIDITDSIDELTAIKKQIDHFKKITSFMEKTLNEKEKKYENKNNLKLC